jgi:predicted RNase H-like nuclease (RuvC/YqgF family)
MSERKYSSKQEMIDHLKECLEELDNITCKSSTYYSEEELRIIYDESNNLIINTYKNATKRLNEENDQLKREIRELKDTVMFLGR